MKKELFTAVCIFSAVCGAQAKDLTHGYPFSPVPFTSVKVTDSFWGQRLKASREVTIPLAFSKCEETGRYENFVKAAHPSEEYKVGGLPFDDTVALAAQYGVAAIVQPGGSIRDDEAIAKADELGVVMLFTGVRHFKH